MHEIWSFAISILLFIDTSIVSDSLHTTNVLIVSILIHCGRFPDIATNVDFFEKRRTWDLDVRQIVNSPSIFRTVEHHPCSPPSYTPNLRSGMVAERIHSSHLRQLGRISRVLSWWIWHYWHSLLLGHLSYGLRLQVAAVKMTGFCLLSSFWCMRKSSSHTWRYARR